MANPSLSIQPETPIIGIEIKPVISNVPEDYLRFTWYRQLYDKNVYCCVHKKKRADIYCSTCHTLMLPLNTSYFCSPVCYHNNWENHQKLHSEWIQYKGLPTTISTRSRLNLGPDYDYYLDDEDINPDDMLEEENGTSWLPVGYSKNYLPSKEDFGSVLKLVAVFVNPSMSSPIPFLYTKHVIESPTPHPRLVIPIGPPPTFRVLTYNLLADCLVNKSHSYCLDWAQSWDYRRQNLLREITSYNADILCLQEVQSNHYDNFLRPELDKLG
ncbi:hypothetical protein AQUCO_00800120v1 [Aquilegia coerulea]|uniref:Endonuclease/exonuclease/phosphatase domain-containing protein n=1 Tax=Aquilegia coerulea TaxID=218851 RepID=A0A2G5EHC1_AQUCA|nr:hypothetical protein AQUCO_00800120v1 [Aquilegia coerulea]